MDDLTPKRLQELAQIILKNPRPDARKEALLEIRRSDHPRVIELLQHVSRHDRDREVRDLAGNLYTKKKVTALQTAAEGGATLPSAADAPTPPQPARPKTGAKADAAAWTCAACGGENSGGQACRFCGADRASGAKKAASDRADSPALADVGAPTDGKIFFLDPANAPGMKGPRADDASGIGGWVLFALLAVMSGIAVIVFALSALNNWRALDMRGVVTSGWITDKRISSGEDSDTYYVSYQFVRDGVAFSGETSVDYDTYKNAERGARVEVLYASDNPAINALAGHNSFPIGQIGFAVCWNAMTVPACMAFVSLILQNLRERKLRRHGQVVFGVLHKVTGHKDSDDDFIVQVTYSFRAPDGSIHEGQASRVRNDLTPGGLPPEGTRVAVLYRTPDHYKLL